MVRAVAKALLRSVGLLELVRNGRALGWAALARETRYRWLGPPDGLPVPPGHLRGLIVAQAEATVDEYLTIGQGCAQAVIVLLASRGVSLAAAAPILDFGCGCGRVARGLWATQPGLPLYGSDINAEQVAWSRAALPFTDVTVNRPTPPLAFPDGFFGLTYAFSVFTHVPAPWQGAWLRELARVTRPGGYVLLSLHGAPYMAANGTLADRARFERGELVVRPRVSAPKDGGYAADGYAGCDVYHPPAYVRGEFAQGLTVVAHVAGQVVDPARNWIGQDLWLFRTPAS